MRPARAPAADSDAIYDPSAEWAAATSRLRELPPRPRFVGRRAAPAFEFTPADALWQISASVRARSRGVQSFVHSASRAHAVAADLVNGIIWTESRFQVHARSPKGACGLMQLMPRTGREVARAIGMSYHPYDPQFNIHAGTYYFARMVERFGGDQELALAAYNIGPGRVETWLRASQPLPGHSRAYVGSVFGAARAFRVDAF